MTATKAADANYNSATATATVTLNMGNQATFATVVYSSPLTNGNSETLSTTGGSGAGEVTYNLLGGGCTLSGATLTATSGTGSCVVSATKAADANYNSTTSASVTVNLSKANQATLTVNAGTPLAYLTSETISTSVAVVQVRSHIAPPAVVQFRVLRLLPTAAPVHAP